MADPSFWALSHAQVVVEAVATVAFALSGLIEGARKRLDAVGVCIVAGLAAFGGGTLRDVLLDRHPIFWFQNTTYLLVIIAAAVFTVIYTRYRDVPLKALLVADAFGLALFTVSGAKIAEQLGMPGIIVVFMAALTGTAGGMLRDVLCAEVPLILRREIYATASIAGAIVYVAGQAAGLDSAVVALFAMALVFALRMAAIFLGWHMPDKPHA